jgi:hypothetical protein
MLMLIHEWLSNLHSHDIYDSTKMAEDFKKETGLEPSWITFTHAEMKRSIEKRGLGGSLGEDNGGGLASGYAVAESLANKYATVNTTHQLYEGRGSRFRAALEALQKSGV